MDQYMDSAVQRYKDSAVKQYWASPGVTRGQAVVRQGHPNKEGFRLILMGKKELVQIMMQNF